MWLVSKWDNILIWNVIYLFFLVLFYQANCEHGWKSKSLIFLHSQGPAVKKKTFNGYQHACVKNSARFELFQENTLFVKGESLVYNGERCQKLREMSHMMKLVQM